MRTHSKNSKSLLLFYVIFTETILLGSGQLVHVTGWLTLKMVLFLLGMVCLITKIKVKWPSYAVNTAINFTLLSVLSIIVGLLFTKNISYLIEDVKPLLVFYLLPFYAIVIKSKNTILIMNKIVMYGSLFMAVLYIIYLLLLQHFLVFEFANVYEGATEMSDIMFRGDKGRLFYKGFLFMPVGIVFWLGSSFSNKVKYTCIAILLVAIFMTETRGFYVISVFCILLYFWFVNRRKFYLILYILLPAALYAVYRLVSIDLSSHDEGDTVRITTFMQVIDMMNPLSIIVGHGFGVGVKIREMHMEMSFLEIFHKQGLLGLAFWGSILFSTNRLFKRLKNRYDRMFATPYFVGIVIIYIQSLFNPYINNPIGLGFILPSIVVIHYIYYEQKYAITRKNPCSDCAVQKKIGRLSDI